MQLNTTRLCDLQISPFKKTRDGQRLFRRCERLELARVLELAGGTGIWTKELARIASDLTVLDAFLNKVRRAVAPGGNVFIVDEPAGGSQVSGPTRDGMYQQRTLQDGRVFNIVRVYYDPLDIQRRLQQRGLEPTGLQTGGSFFHLVCTRDRGE